MSGKPLGDRPMTAAERLARYRERPEPPSVLDEVAQAEWRRVASILHESGALNKIDHGTLAAYCQMYSRWVAAERALATMAKLDPVTGGLMIKTSNGNAIQNPLVGIANTAAAAMARFAAEFGMTPSARNRVVPAYERRPESAEILGKKEQANLAAETAAEGTRWSDLVH
jgi:P27 family predicted phage terminase small subunit